MVKHYIFLGAPGVGKGTMAKMLAHEQNLVHISTGEIFRNEIAAKSALGKKVEAIVNSGGYVPDDITNQVLLKAVAAANAEKRGFILDGYPRTLQQVEFLKANHIRIDRVIVLTAPQKILINRLMARGRKDDTLAVIKERIKIYNTATKPLVDYYKAAKLVTNVASHETVDENFTSLKQALKHD